MLGGETNSRYVQIHVNSSIASGIAALVLDVLLLTFIKSRAQAFCSAANVYLVYERKKAICPRRSRLGSFTGGPVGPLQLSRFFSLLIVISTVCMVILGFSINGKTIQRYEEQTFQSVVKITGRPIAIDFNREFETRGAANSLMRNKSGSEEKLVSKRLVAVSGSFLCKKRNYTHVKLYAFAFKDTYLDKEMAVLGEKIPDGACVQNPSFQEPLISREYRLKLPGTRRSCNLTVSQPPLPENERYGSAGFEVGNCDVDVKWLKCFRGNRNLMSCATMSRGTGVYDKNTFILLLPNAGYTNEVDISAVSNSLASRDWAAIALNVAFFSAAGFGGGVSNLANMAITDIHYIQTLHHLVGDEEVSELDLRVFVPAICFVLGSTALLMTSATILWATTVCGKDRRNCNTFSTFEEVLSVASKTNIFSSKGSGEDLPYLGVGRHHPKILVVGREQRDECSNAGWKEGEIGQNNAADASVKTSEKHYNEVKK